MTETATQEQKTEVVANATDVAIVRIKDIENKWQLFFLNKDELTALADQCCKATKRMLKG